MRRYMRREMKLSCSRLAMFSINMFPIRYRIRNLLILNQMGIFDHVVLRDVSQV